MPEYLNFASKLTDLEPEQAAEQLRQQIELVQQAQSRLEENYRIEPSTLERMVSV